MKLRTTVSLTAVVAIVLFAGLQTIKDETDKRKVSIIGMWLNSPRPEMVEVGLSVGSDTKVTRHINAPFGPRVYKLAPGTHVMIRLRLLGASGAKNLQCRITVDNAVAMETPPQPAGVQPGTEVMCWAVA